MIVSGLGLNIRESVVSVLPFLPLLTSALLPKSCIEQQKMVMCTCVVLWHLYFLNMTLLLVDSFIYSCSTNNLIVSPSYPS